MPRSRRAPCGAPGPEAPAPNRPGRRKGQLRGSPSQRARASAYSPEHTRPVFVMDVLRRAAATAFLSLPEPALGRIVGPPIRSPEGWALDVQSQALLWLMRAVGESAEYGDVAEARRTIDRSACVLAPRSPSGVRVEDRQVPGGSGPRRARVYSCEGSSGLAPGLVWFHGG